MHKNIVSVFDANTLQIKIDEQSDLVRCLKANKANKRCITDAVDYLKRLKCMTY